MKNQQSLSFLLLTVCLLLSSSLKAQVSKTVDVATAGTLPTLITASEKNQITHLTLSGNLNGTDIRFIREMAGRNMNKKEISGKLSVLDLSQANIVSGGGYYFKHNREGVASTDSNARYTSDNVIGKGMFSGFSGLTQVVLPNSITSIADGAFLGCEGLTSLIIPNKVTSINFAAFAGCCSLTSLIIPDNVTSIGDAAFAVCTDLTSLKISNHLTSIGGSTFLKCTGLTSLTIGNNVTSIGVSAFKNCTGLTSVQIPNSVTTIDDEAFHSCSGLTSVAIGSGVKSIGSSVFHNCEKLKKIGVSEENSFYCQVDGVLYSKDMMTLIKCPNARSGKYEILEGVGSIGNDAFSGCNRLKSITIPKSVTSIESHAFTQSSIKKIHCEALTPPSYPSYKQPARNNSNNKEIKEFNAFYKKCKIYVPKGTAAAYKNAEGWKNFKNIIEE